MAIAAKQKARMRRTAWLERFYEWLRTRRASIRLPMVSRSVRVFLISSTSLYSVTPPLTPPLGLFPCAARKKHRPVWCMLVLRWVLRELLLHLCFQRMSKHCFKHAPTFRKSSSMAPSSLMLVPFGMCLASMSDRMFKLSRNSWK